MWLAEAGSITTTDAENQLKLARELETVEHEPVNDALPPVRCLLGMHSRS